MKKVKVFTLSLFLVYVITFSVLVQFGSSKEFILKETHGKFTITLTSWAPYGFIINKKPTILCYIYRPFFNLIDTATPCL